MLEELLRRSECRMACRRLGIIEVRRSGAHMLLLSSAIDNVKWEGLSRVIPKVRFIFDQFHFRLNVSYHSDKRCNRDTLMMMIMYDDVCMQFFYYSQCVAL